MPRTIMELDYRKGYINNMSGLNKFDYYTIPRNMGVGVINGVVINGRNILEENKMKVYHICYHTDEDGLASAAVIYEYLKRINKNNETKMDYFFYKVDYTMDLKEVLPKNIPAGDELYFVDYSFSNEDNLKYILELSNNIRRVTWIDHHKTSYDIAYGNDINKLNKYDYPNFHYYIDTNYCGAYLAYLYAWYHINYYGYITGTGTDPSFNIKDWLIPLYIKYVDSWDTWKHNMPNTEEFNLGIRSVKRTPKNVFGSMLKYDTSIIGKLFSEKPEDIKSINSCMKKYLDNIIDNGKAIKAYQDVENESLCNDYGFEFNIIDHSDSKRIYHCFAVNSRGGSTMFGNRVNEYDIVVPFRFNGEKYVYSLFTAKDDVDCSELAKKIGSVDGLGGGGHAKAAGFQTYTQMIKTDCTVNICDKSFKKNKYNIFTV